MKLKSSSLYLRILYVVCFILSFSSAIEVNKGAAQTQ